MPYVEFKCRCLGHFSFLLLIVGFQGSMPEHTKLGGMYIFFGEGGGVLLGEVKQFHSLKKKKKRAVMAVVGNDFFHIKK